MHVTVALVALALLVLCVLSAAADTQQPAYPAWMVEGLRVEPAGGMKVHVTAGVAEIGGLRVSFSETTLELSPPPVIEVGDEKTALSEDKPQAWANGTSLRDVTCFPGGVGTPLPYCLKPGSVRVKLGPGRALAYEEGHDYLLDQDWGKIGRAHDGSIAQGQEVYLDYAYRLMRLDSVALGRDGKVTLVRGAARKTCPAPPDLDDGSARLANVLVWYGTTEVTPGLIFPCGPAFAEPDDAERARRQALVPHTLAKLRAGEDVVVCTWGDSVTAGGDAIPVQRAYPWTFTAALRDRYPKARVTLVNAGIGGTSTAGRLPNLQKEVLDFHPDLVTIEFVNDCGLPPDTLRANWRDAIGQIRATGADVIILTPHYVMPPWMGGTYESMWWTDNRAAIQVMREVAQEKGAGIADTTHRWEHLCLEGLPYITLLWNGINHPDNRGHDLFTADLLTFF